MRSSTQVLAIMALAAVSAAAQAPGAPPAMRGRAGGGAQGLLARSAQLDLTDAQVAKLAGIARRTEARHRTMRAAMDSARTRFAQPGDSVARRAFAQRMRTDMTKEQDQARVDLRDAIAVLTPDQQAKAWEMNARAGRPGRGGAMRPRGDMPRDRMNRPGMPRDRMNRPDMPPRAGMGPGRPGRPDADGFPKERNPQ